MLPNDTYGHLQMVQEFGETIRWKSKHILEDDVLFATSATKQLFKITTDNQPSVLFLTDQEDLHNPFGFPKRFYLKKERYRRQFLRVNVPQSVQS